MPPQYVREVEDRLVKGEGVKEISARLAIPMTEVQAVRDRMVATAAPRDHRLDSLLEAGDASHRHATRQLSAKTRKLVDQLREQVAVDKREQDLRDKVDELSRSLTAARAELRQVRR
jgi:hypothetical protein